MLEDFMSIAHPIEDILWPIAQETVQHVITKNRRFPQTQESLKRIFIPGWSGRKNQETYGLAITKRYSMHLRSMPNNS
jgi:hypothetical protein